MRFISATGYRKAETFNSSMENQFEVSKLVKVFEVHSGAVFKTDGEYAWSTQETHELLLENHFPGFVKQEKIERTNGMNW